MAMSLHVAIDCIKHWVLKYSNWHTDYGAYCMTILGFILILIGCYQWHMHNTCIEHLIMSSSHYDHQHNIKITHTEHYILCTKEKKKNGISEWHPLSMGICIYLPCGPDRWFLKETSDSDLLMDGYVYCSIHMSINA